VFVAVSTLACKRGGAYAALAAGAEPIAFDAALGIRNGHLLIAVVTDDDRGVRGSYAVGEYPRDRP
jgi:hypothetical protein